MASLSSRRVDHDLYEASDRRALLGAHSVEAFEDVAGGEAVCDGDAGGMERGHGDAVDGDVEGDGQLVERVGVGDGAQGSRGQAVDGGQGRRT